MIKSTRDDAGVEVVTFDRPDKRNALTPEMFTELRLALMGEDKRAARSALVIGGEGPVFCGGFDLKMCLDEPGTMRKLLTALSELILDLRSLDAPVVIAAHGAALAGGCALLGGADYVVTNDEAKLGYPVVRLGVSPAVSAPFLRQMIGNGRSRVRLLEGQLLSGKEAARIGLASESVATSEEVMARAVSVAGAMAAKPGSGFATTKRWLSEVEDGGAGIMEPRRSIIEQGSAALGASLSIEGQAEERDRLRAMFTKPEGRSSPKGQ